MSHITKAELRKDFYRLLDLLDVGSRDSSTVQALLNELRQAGMRLSNLGEQACNGVRGPDGHMKWDDADQRRNDDACMRAETRVKVALDKLFDVETFNRLDIEFQGDPRGPSVIIGIKNGPQRVLCIW